MNATLIYDGDCPLCCKAMDWVQARALSETLEYLPCQAPERAERFPELREAQCMEAIQLVMDDGTVYSGDKALPPLFRVLRGWRWAAMLFRVPGVTLLAPHAYGFIAKRRHVFSVLVARKHMPSEAECAADESCSRD